jgi:hypothetical protein
MHAKVNDLYSRADEKRFKYLEITISGVTEQKSEIINGLYKKTGVLNNKPQYKKIYPEVSTAAATTVAWVINGKTNKACWTIFSSNGEGFITIALFEDPILFRPPFVLQKKNILFRDYQQHELNLIPLDHASKVPNKNFYPFQWYTFVMYEINSYGSIYHGSKGIAKYQPETYTWIVNSFWNEDEKFADSSLKIANDVQWHLNLFTYRTLTISAALGNYSVNPNPFQQFPDSLFASGTLVHFTPLTETEDAMLSLKEIDQSMEQLNAAFAIFNGFQNKMQIQWYNNHNLITATAEEEMNIGDSNCPSQVISQDGRSTPEQELSMIEEISGIKEFQPNSDLVTKQSKFIQESGLTTGSTTPKLEKELTHISTQTLEDDTGKKEFAHYSTQTLEDDTEKKEIEELKSKNEELEKQNNRNEEEKREMKGIYEQKIREYEIIIEKLKQEKSDFVTLYDGLKSSTDQEIQKFKEESEICKTEITNQKQNSTQMKKQNKDVEQKNIELMENNKVLQNRIETLTEQVTKNENEKQQRAQKREEIMNKHKAQIQQNEDDLENSNAVWKEAMNTLQKDHKSELEAKEKEIQRIKVQVSKKDVSLQPEILKSSSSKTNKDVLVQTDEMDENSNPNDQQQNNVLNANPFPEEQYYEFEDQVIWIKNLMEMQQEF